MDLAHNLSLYRSDSARARLFGRFLADDTCRATDAALVVHEALRLHAGGPLDAAVDNAQGVCWINVDDAVGIVGKMLRGVAPGDLAAAQGKIRSRAKTLSAARRFTGASRATYNGTDRFMDLDDCVEVVFDLLRQEDDRLTTHLASSYADKLAEERGGSSANDERPTLHDLEAMVRVVDESAADDQFRLLGIYRLVLPVAAATMTPTAD